MSTRRLRAALEAIGVPVGLELGELKTTFSDLPESHPHAAAIRVAAFYGLISGDTAADGTPLNTVRPDDFINRAEVSKLIAVTQGLMRKSGSR